MITKICETCRIEKSAEEFIKNRGYLTRTCKKCRKSTCKNDSCNNMVYGNAICASCNHLRRHGKPRKRESKMGMRTWLCQCLNSTKRCSESRLRRGYKIKENDLTIEFLLELLKRQDNKCLVSGIELQSEYNNICSASIDRINHEIGYLQTNVALTCQWVNMGRNRTSMEDFKKILVNLPNKQ